jgi:sulfate transport system ATP-binding protein
VLNRSGEVGQGADVLAFARPHEIEIHTETDASLGVPAKVVRVLRFGLNTRVELDSVDLQTAQHFDVEISAERAAKLNLQEGQLVRLSAKALKVFDVVGAA